MTFDACSGSQPRRRNLTSVVNHPRTSHLWLIPLRVKLGLSGALVRCPPLPCMQTSKRTFLIGCFVPIVLQKGVEDLRQA